VSFSAGHPGDNNAALRVGLFDPDQIPRCIFL
jgi:hypothetical protein